MENWLIILICCFLPFIVIGFIKLVLYICFTISENISYKRNLKKYYYDCVDELIKSVSVLDTKYNNICRSFNSKLSVFDDSFYNFRIDLSDLELRVLSLEKKNKKINKKKNNIK